MDYKPAQVNQIDETPDFGKPIKRNLKQISNFKQTKMPRQPFQATKMIQKQQVKMKSKDKEYPFPLYDERSVFTFPEGMDKVLISRQQDDDNESDDEVVYSSVRYNYKCLVVALGQANGKQYTLEQFGPDSALGFNS